MKLLRFNQNIFTNFISVRYIIRSNVEPTPLENKNYTNYQLKFLDQHANRKLMIDCDTERSVTFGDMKQIIKNISSGLTEGGMGRNNLKEKQKRIAIIAKNSIHYFSLLLGIVGCGNIAVPMNPNATEKEINSMLDTAKPEVIFGDPDVLKDLHKPSFVKKVFSTSHTKDQYDGTLASLIEHTDRHCPLNDDLDEYCDETCVNVFSSGTTGLPKAVELSHNNLIASSISTADMKSIRPYSTLCGVLPFFHIYGILIYLNQSLVTGSKVIVMPKFDPELFVNSISKFKISHLHLVPPIALFLVNHPNAASLDLTSVTDTTIGAAPLDAQVEVRLSNMIKEKNPKFFVGQGYGLSELSGAITFLTYHDKMAAAKRGSVGKVATHIDLKIVSLEDRNVELGQHQLGEIMARGPLVMKGYLGIEKDDPRSGFEGEWLSTGDIGYFDEDEYLYISDRKKEMIKVDAFQVAPAELEGLIVSHPEVNDCAVIGVSDERHGEVPRAFVVKKNNSNVTETDIENFVAENVSKYKHLKGGVVFVDAIPKTASGKILRKLLKEKQR